MSLGAAAPAGLAGPSQYLAGINRYAAPCDWTPPVADAIAKMYRGTLTAAAAHDAAVKGVLAIVVNFMSS